MLFEKFASERLAFRKSVSCRFESLSTKKSYYNAEKDGVVWIWQWIEWFGQGVNLNTEKSLQRLIFPWNLLQVLEPENEIIKKKTYEDGKKEKKKKERKKEIEKEIETERETEKEKEKKK